MAAPDGGWGWIVVIGCFFNFFISGGIERCFGVWYVELLNRYESSATLTAWTIGVHVAIRQMLFPLGTVLYNKMTIRALIMAGGVLTCIGLFCSAFVEDIYIFYLTFGVLGGLGSSLVTFGSQIAIAEYFEERKMLAYALALTGSGAGSFALSTLLTYLFIEFTYFEAVVILSGIALNSLVGGALCFPIYEPTISDPETQPLLQNGTSKLNYSSSFSKSTGITIRLSPLKPKLKLRKLNGNRNFETDLILNIVVIIYAFGAIIAMMGSFPIPQLVVDYAVEKGESLETASLLMTFSGIMEIVVRIGLGFVLSVPAIKPYVVEMWNMSFIGFAISAIGIAFSSMFWHFLLCLLINVISHSIARGFSVIMFAAVFETSAFASAYSIYSFVLGIGILSSTALSGYLKDVTGSYLNSYLIMCGLCLLSSCVFWLNYLLARRLKSNSFYRLR